METDAAIVELYGLMPEQFIGVRNQLAKAARDAGDQQTATAVAALRKPTVSAWLANQLVRTDPDGIHALTQLGEQLRETYLSSDSTRRRELTRQRHDLVRNLVRVARDQAAGGRRVTPQTTERLTETLDAALVDPAAAQLLRSGQLTSALRHVGFGVVDENGDPVQLAPSDRASYAASRRLAKARLRRPRSALPQRPAARRSTTRSRSAEPPSGNAETRRNRTTHLPRPSTSTPARCSTRTSIESPTSKPTLSDSTTNLNRPARRCAKRASKPGASNAPSTRPLATPPPSESGSTPRSSV